VSPSFAPVAGGDAHAIVEDSLCDGCSVTKVGSSSERDVSDVVGDEHPFSNFESFPCRPLNRRWRCAPRRSVPLSFGSVVDEFRWTKGDFLLPYLQVLKLSDEIADFVFVHAFSRRTR